MEVLEQALPRFIGIIGDRYGWMPPGSAVSVTEQEITTALGYENCYPLFLFRDPARPDGSGSLDFLDDSDAGEDALQKADKLSLLRTRIEESSTARVRRYHCSIREGKVVPDAAFAIQALDGLRESLRSLYATDDAPTEPTPSDTVGHALNFASERAAEWLEGLRDDALTRITDFLTSETGHLHILGEGGSGKTSLLAKALDEILDESTNDGRVVLAAFCGAHRGAESGEAVLRGFADRLVDSSISASDDHDPSRPPSDFDGLRTWFSRRIADTKAVLLIDGIDQLPERDRFLTWLPNPVPDGVTVLTGSLDAASTTHLSEHWKARGTDVITLSPLDNLSGARFVKSQLTRYRKTLSEAALTALLAKPGASTPLYLRIAAEELRTKGVRENLESDISGMPGTAGGMFLWVLQRLASDHQFRWSDGHRAVASLLGCVGVARDGLSEDELVTLLSGIDAAGSDPLGDVAVLLQLLRPYLGQRGERYAPLHRVFSEVLHGVGIMDADRSLLGSEHPAPLDELSEVQRAHGQLASLFAGSSAGNIRRLSEEAWHRIHSGDLDGACALLTDFSVLKSRVEAGLVRGVLEDMDALVRAASDADWPVPEELRVWLRLFRRRREFWEQFPDEFHQDCLNEAEGLSTTESAKANPIEKPWIRWVNKPEHEIRHGWEWMVRDASCAAFSPDGKTVAVGGTDGSLRLLDAETGYEIWRVRGHGDNIDTLHFHLLGKQVVFSESGPAKRCWCTTSGTELDFNDFQDEVDFYDSSRINTGPLTPKSSYLGLQLKCIGNTIEVLDTAKHVCLYTYNRHPKPVIDASFLGTSHVVYSIDFDGESRLWDVRTGIDVLDFERRSNRERLSSWFFVDYGKKVIVDFHDGIIEIFDSGSGVSISTCKYPGHYITSATMRLNGNLLLVMDSGLCVFYSESRYGSLGIADHTYNGSDLTIRCDHIGSYCISTGIHTCYIWDIKSCKVVRSFDFNDAFLRSSDISHDGKIVLVHCDKRIRVTDLQSGYIIAERLELDGYVGGAQFLPDSQSIVFWNWYKHHRCPKVFGAWSVKTGWQLFQTSTLDDFVENVDFGNQSNKILARTQYDLLYLVDVNTGSIEEASQQMYDYARSSELATAAGCETELGRDVSSSIVEVDAGVYLTSETYTQPPKAKACIHFECTFKPSTLPADPLSFVAGCADGSVRFFRLEGVELPVTH
jgi:WD40 repeat protein